MTKTKNATADEPEDNGLDAILEQIKNAGDLVKKIKEITDKYPQSHTHPGTSCGCCHSHCHCHCWHYQPKWVYTQTTYPTVTVPNTLTVQSGTTYTSSVAYGAAGDGGGSTYNVLYY